MSEIGVIKEFDKLGRIVIPKELRDRYGLLERVEIIATEQGLLLQSPNYVLVKKEKSDA
jgi:AbrB family looped-hinge helix DNA binding protein